MIFNYEIHESLSTRDLLEKINIFAIANGWSSVYFNKFSNWEEVSPGNYNFVSGTDANLALESPGYGGQVLHFRLVAFEDGDNSVSDWIRCHGFDRNNNSVIYTSSTHPIFNGEWTTNNNRYKTNVPRSISKCWLFANEYTIIVCIQADTDIIVICFGTIELFDSTVQDFNYCPYVHPSAHFYKYFDREYKSPFAYRDDLIYFNGGSVDENSIEISVYNFEYNEFDGNYQYELLNNKNNYSSFRPKLNPCVYIKDLDNKYFPVGYLPIYLLNVDDFLQGQLIKEGLKEYFVFTNCLLEGKAGFAVRVL